MQTGDTGVIMPIERKPNIFFLETILAIAFLAIASGVLAQLFTGAHLASKRSGELTRAVQITQNAAALFKAAGANPDTLADALGGKSDGGVVRVSYDENMAVCGGEGTYSMIIAISGGPLYEAEISLFRHDEPVYGIEAALFLPEGGAR